MRAELKKTKETCDKTVADKDAEIAELKKQLRYAIIVSAGLVCYCLGLF